MGVSAARLHRVIPRALATAVVTVPKRHDPIRLADRQALVRLVVRDTARLDAERVVPELDLVKRPGSVTPSVRCGRRWSSCIDGAVQTC